MCASLGRVAALLECVENQVEAVLERFAEVVADLGDVTSDDFGEVRKLIRERGELLLLRFRVELLDLLLRNGYASRTEYAWIVISIEKPASRR
jgi:hypothetical protein